MINPKTKMNEVDISEPYSGLVKCLPCPESTNVGLDCLNVRALAHVSCSAAQARSENTSERVSGWSRTAVQGRRRITASLSTIRWWSVMWSRGRRAAIDKRAHSGAAADALEQNRPHVPVLGPDARRDSGVCLLE